MTFLRIAASREHRLARLSRALSSSLHAAGGSPCAGALLAASLLLLSLFLAAGCGLSGGSIPGGPATSGGIPTSRSFQAEGQVQLAAAPYSSVTAATVTIRNGDGSVAAGPTRLSGSGSFSFTGLPAGNTLSLTVTPQDPSMQSVTIPFASAGSAPVQFVVALPPAGAAPPASIRLTADNLSPAVQQTAQIQAVLTGGTSGIAPSWLAFGGVGTLSAVGPVAVFVTQSPGVASIFAVSGGASAALSLTIPSSSGGGTAGSTTGVLSPPAPPTLPGGVFGTGSTSSPPLTPQ